MIKELFCLQARVCETDLETRACQSVAWELNLGTTWVFLNSSMKNFNSIFLPL